MSLKGSATAADLHLRRHVWSSRQSLVGDTIFALESFFKYCIENRYSIKLAGDIFHTLAVRPEYVASLFKQLDAAQDAEIPVYAIQGNHDDNEVPWPVLHARGSHVQYIHKTRVELPEAAEVLYGISYLKEEELRKTLDDLPSDVNTLLMHQAETEALPFGPNFDTSWVPSTVKNILIGDIHASQHYVKDGIHVYYPGSLAVSNIDQLQSGKFLVETALDGKTQIEHVDVPGRGFYELYVKTKEDAATVETTLRLIAVEDERVNNFEPVVVIRVLPEFYQEVYACTMFLRSALCIYPWIIQTSNLAPGGGDTLVNDSAVIRKRSIYEVIRHSVKDQRVGTLLEALYRTPDTSGVLRSRLDEVL